MVVNLKDKLIISTTNADEKIALTKGNPVLIGDQVLVHPQTDGTHITHGNSNIGIGDMVTVYTTDNGEYVAVKGGNCFLISKGYNHPVSKVGQIESIGVFKYRWDGLGRVYVSSSCCTNVETDLIALDDELIVENMETKHHVRCAYNAPSGGRYVIPGPDLELTPILKEGTNTLSFYIHDIYGAGIGCGSLYISQTYLKDGGEHILITPGYSRKISTYGIETDDIGTFEYTWNGIGKVYISSSYCADPSVDKIVLDDQVIVTNSNGVSVSASNPSDYNPLGVPDLEITSLLIDGINELTFHIHDLFGTAIGCEALYLVQY
jgi:hypothetical protein